MSKSLVLCCLLASFVAAAFACNGCSVKKFTTTPCASNNVIQFHLDSLVLTSDCKAKPRGWINSTKTVKELHSKWEFQKGMLKKNGDSDGCESLEKASKDKDSGAFIKLFGLPEKCPIEKGHVRINKDADLSKYKDKMHFLHGPSSGKMDISHGSAGRTCYTYEAVIDCKSG